MLESVPDSPPTDLSTRLTDAQTGTKGLDDVLGGGLTRNRLYVVEGVPGSGKTTLALRFLTEGAQTGRAGAVHHVVRNRRRAAGRSPIA